MEWFIELYKIGGVELNGDGFKEGDIEDNLNPDERQAVDKTFKCIAFYLAGLPSDEGIKAGILPLSEEYNSDSPEVLKKYVLGMLAPYKSGKFKTKEEIKKEIKTTWDKMRNALQAGNVDDAAEYFSDTVKDSYRKNFQVLKEKGVLANFASGLIDMEVVEVDISYAKGDLRSVEDGKEFSYQVLFHPEGEGVWKIDSF